MRQHVVHERSDGGQGELEGLGGRCLGAKLVDDGESLGHRLMRQFDLVPVELAGE